MASMAAVEVGCAHDSPAPPSAPKAGDSQPAPRREEAARTEPMLRRLLEENRKLDPEHGVGFANHLSMAVSALSWLGADDARLQAFWSARVARLQPLRARAAQPPSDWRQGIGDPGALVDLNDYFERCVVLEGRQALLERVLPELMPGLSGGAFHGLIRTSYALHATDDAELALALAYFATVAAPLRSLPEPSRESLSARQILVRAEADPKFVGPRQFGLISPALRAAAERPGFDETLAALQLSAGTLDEIALAALSFYLGTRDFVGLHCVTGTHALRLLLPYVGDQQLALRYLFQAVLAAFVSVAERRLQPPSRAQPPDFPALIARVLVRNDEHDIKLVYTCLEESSLRAPAAYREAAALRLGI